MLARGSIQIVLLPVAAAIVSLVLLIGILLPLALALFVVFIALAGLTANFFRDPDREIGEGIVSPADGILRTAEKTAGGTYFSIFMNIHDVHVNRAPWPGRVLEVVRLGGLHRPAYQDGAEKNARAKITIETSLGNMTITLISGIVARRALPYVKAGQYLEKGERISIIRFGSRVDMLVPTRKIKIKVKAGERVLAGTTTIAVPGGDR